MKTRYFFSSTLSFLLLSYPIALVAAQNPLVTVNVDAMASRHAINPNIYGTAYATTDNLIDLNPAFHRLGGNNTTRYNWQINADNKGSDWYFESIPLVSALAGEAAETFLLATKAAGGVEAGFTIPLINWVAKLGANRNKLSSFSQAKYGAQSDADWNWFPDAGNGVYQSNGKWITGNDPNDANVANSSLFQSGFVNHLISKFGVAGSGGLKYYIMDNEPSLWWATHRDVAPLGQTMDEARDTFLDYGRMIKNLDPNAKIMGPEEWGWTGYFYSGRDQRIGNTVGWSNLPDRAAHANWDYLPWLLDQLHQRDVAESRRILEVFTVHFYPQGGEFSWDSSTAMQLRRNRSTRALWDPSYVDETWIGTPVNLIPRLKSWVNTYYPGTQIGLTEYNWGGEDNINGATTQADVLGIFGREGLDMAARWATPANNLITFKGMQIYRNYDRFGSTFGDLSVQASVPNPDQISTFGATRTYDGALTLMVVNKVLSGNTPVNINLSNYAASGPVEVWQITNNNRISRLQDLNVNANVISMTAPRQSINLLIVKPVPSALPHIPSVPQATAGVGQVEIKWRSLANAQTYTVYRSLTAGGPYLPVGAGVTQPDYVDTNLDPGIHYYYTISASNGFGESAKSAEVTAIPIYSMRINCGGGRYVGSDGSVWMPDSLFDKGYNWGFANYGIADTGDPGRYWTARDGTSYSYHLPVQSGLYNLKLHFMDDTTGTGQRKFNVTANGSPLLTNFDIFADAGGNYRADVKSFNVTCTDTGINLKFDGVIASVVVSGIELSTISLTPPSPTGLTATPGDHSVMLNWQGVTRAAAYTVFRATNVAGPFTILSSTVDGAGYQDVAVSNGTTYYYKVQATDQGGSSGDSNVASATPSIQPPPAPGAVSIIAGDGNLILTWANVTSTTSFTVKRSLLATGPFVTIATGLDGAGMQNVGLTNGTQYFYEVFALNSGGSSLSSPIASGTPIAPLPGMPTGMTAIAGDTNVLLQWAGVSRATGFTVKRSINAAGPFTIVASGLDGAGYQDINVINGTKYYYVVAATNTSGSGPDSSVVNATPTDPIPAMVTGLTATVGNRNVLLQWTGVSRAKSYTVSRSLTAGGTYTVIATGVDGASFQNVGLTNGVTYFYIVQAVNGGGTGPPSTEISATPHP
ncbi:MAG: glycoside hydrolase family 44 protein [Chthonomonadales bacterium]